MHAHDGADEVGLHTTEDDADDPDLPELMRERRERLKYVQYRERLASLDSRLPESTRRASAQVSSLLDEAATASSTSALRVLILEDDPATQDVFSLLLAPEEGFEADYVSEVATCLERLRATSARSDSGSDSGSDCVSSTERLPPLPFEVLLLDVHLRGGHLGTEVFTAAQNDPGLQLPPTVICTALADRTLAAIVKDCGVGLLAYNVRVVLKPFNIETLTTELRSAACSRTAVLTSASRPGARGGALAMVTQGTPKDS